MTGHEELHIDAIAKAKKIKKTKQKKCYSLFSYMCRVMAVLAFLGFGNPDLNLIHVIYPKNSALAFSGGFP